VQPIRRDPEEGCEELRSAAESRDPAIGVVQDHEVPAGGQIAARRPGDLANHRQRVDRRGCDAPTDVANDRCFSGLHPEHVHWIDAGIHTADDLAGRNRGRWKAAQREVRRLVGAARFEALHGDLGAIVGIADDLSG
jgi:hypothetical protein